MNKRDLIECVAAELGGSRQGAEKAVKAVLESILDGLDRDGAVTIAGFGTSNARSRRRGRVGTLGRANRSRFRRAPPSASELRRP